MDKVCVCCLVEAESTKSLESSCVFLPQKCYDNISPGALPLRELYYQLTQLPPVVEEHPSSSLLMMGYQICSRCVDMLQDFYLFRLRALKSHEELQTKANIANIIIDLEQSSVGSVRPERLEEDFGQEEVQNGPFRCVVCQKMYKLRKSLSRHEKTHGQSSLPKKSISNKSFAAKGSCQYRESNKEAKKTESSKNRKEDPSRSNFDGRLRLPSTPKQPLEGSQKQRKLFPCDLCSKHFTRKSSLNQHKVILHAGVRRFSCHICQRAFGKEDSLKTHLALHLGKRHRCKLCGKAFAKNGFLRKHLEDHESTDGGRTHACSVCSKRFTAKSHLTDHERIHDDKRPYKCNVCGNAFRQRQQLKIHSYQHVGKPFRCTDCSATFGARTRLKAHAEKYHRKTEEASTTETEPDFGNEVVNEEILNEICYQIDSNPVILQNIEADGVSLICCNSEQIVFLADDSSNLLPDMIGL